MSKKDYERAASIAQRYSGTDGLWRVTEAFVELFRDDSPRFNEARFRAACVPSANVKARPRKT